MDMATKDELYHRAGCTHITIPEDKLAALLMHCGPVPDGKATAVKRDLFVFKVLGYVMPVRQGRELDDWMENLLHAIKLVYDISDADVLYAIAIEYVDQARKRYRRDDGER